MSFGIAQVHTHQHAGPVLAFRTSGTGVDLQHAVHLVGLVAKHVLQFEYLDGIGSFTVSLVHLFFGHQFVFIEVESQLQFVGQGLHFVVSLNPLLQAFHLLHLRFGSLLVVPEAGCLRAQLLFFYLNLFPFDVQIAAERFGTFLDVLQLFYGNHLSM